MQAWPTCSSQRAILSLLDRSPMVANAGRRFESSPSGTAVAQWESGGKRNLKGLPTC
jgi:hypothetical protein